MKTYDVYQQQRPSVVIRDNGDKEFLPNLVCVGKIIAENGAQAIDDAKKLGVFRIATGLQKFPIVEERRREWA